jgi:hypothetical protein
LGAVSLDNSVEDETAPLSAVDTTGEEGATGEEGGAQAGVVEAKASQGSRVSALQLGQDDSSEGTGSHHSSDQWRGEGDDGKEELEVDSVSVVGAANSFQERAAE